MRLWLTLGAVLLAAPALAQDNPLAILEGSTVAS